MTAREEEDYKKVLRTQEELKRLIAVYPEGDIPEGVLSLQTENWLPQQLQKLFTFSETTEKEEILAEIRRIQNLFQIQELWRECYIYNNS